MANDWGSIEVQGLNELDAQLERLDNEMSGKALFSALNVALTPVVKEAKARASVAPEPHYMTVNGKKVVVQPGLLESSIRKRRLPKSEHVGEFAEGAVMGVLIGKGTKQKLYPRYWHFIELGTSKMQAAPFIRPSFDHNVDNMVNRFADKLSKNIDKLSK